MTFTATITSQGQLNIPIKVRRLLDLEKTQKAIVTVKSGKLIVEPVKDLFELGGSFKTTKKPLSNKELDQVIVKIIAREYKDKFKYRK